MALPLRLAAEPVCRARLGNCFILPSSDEDAVCLVVGEGGLVAVACSRELTSEEIARYIGCDAGCVPGPESRVVMPGNKWGGSAAQPKATHPLQQCACGDPQHKCLVPKRVVEGIQKYYARQVLEPSIRGFLSILEKQFPRNDLYLFELLQNAVDDGASMVSFNTSNAGLHVTHNGKRFTALDVLGLASVGLSTKGTDSSAPKRTLGFMGVGFKAVYKRYAKVVVGDSQYGFAFEERRSDPSVPSHGWVMLPQWTPIVSASPGSDASDRASWCRFSLEQPRGGVASVAQDLKNLPRSIPPLLGRQSLDNFALKAISQQASFPTEWVLEWNKTTHRVSRPSPKRPPRALLADCQGGSERIDVDVGGAGSRSRERWQFVTLRFRPDEAAKAAYQVHIKRNWSGTDGFEETSLFFELDAQGCPVLNAKGAVHAVLPTKLTLPCPLQWQGSWLLSVDRQDVQNTTDNDWNSCLLRQTPRLLACIFAWLAGDQELATPTTVRAALSLFPAMEAEKGGGLVASLLGQRVSMQPLLDYLSSQPCVPVRLSSSGGAGATIGFEKSSRAIWLPPPIVARLASSGLVSKWFGLVPLCTDALCDATAWMELWRCALVLPTSARLAQSRRQFKPTASAGSLPSLATQLAVFAAFAETAAINLASAATTYVTTGSSRRVYIAPAAAAAAAAAAREKDKSNKASLAVSDDTPDSLCCSWLPPLRDWPIFVSSRGDEATSGELVWLSEDWASLSADVRAVLRPGALCVVEMRRSGPGAGGGRGGGGISLLHAALEEAVLCGRVGPATVAGGARWQEEIGPAADVDPALVALARALFSTCRLAHPANVVTPEQAACQLLASYAAAAGSRPVSEAVVKSCVSLFSWAFSAGLPLGASHVLCGAPSSLRLFPTSQAYMGKAYGGAEGEALEATFPSLPFLSPLYAQSAGAETSASKMASLAKFLRDCGVRRGLCFVASARQVDKEAQALGLGAIKLRSSQPGEEISLPFSLGPVNKKHLYEVDVHAAQEWRLLLTSRLTPAQAAVFSDSLAQACKSFECDEKSAPASMPYAAAFFKGKEDKAPSGARAPADYDRGPGSTNTIRSFLHASGPLAGADLRSSLSAIPLLKRCYFLPPGQAGGSTSLLGPASVVALLASSPWVPCSAPGSVGPGAAATLVCAPRECVLSESPSSADMPVARFSAATRAAIEKLPPVVQAAFKWGSVKPKAPVDKLEQLTSDVVRLDGKAAVSAESEAEGGRDEAAGRAMIGELASVWRALCAALKEGRLSAQEKQRIIKCCYSGAAVLPRADDRIPLSRVLSLPVREHAAGASDDELAVRALVSVGFVLDLRAAPGPHLDFALVDLLRPSSVATPALAADFLNTVFDSRHRFAIDCAYACPLPAQAPSYVLKKAISWSLLLLTKPLSGLAPWAARLKLGEKIKALHLFCRRGPTLGPDAFPARWVEVPLRAAKSTHTPGLWGAVRPCLVDDERKAAGCGVSKGSMLFPSHGFQPLASLDSALTRVADRDEETTRLISAERIVLDVLAVPRTSDNAKFKLLTSVYGPKQDLPGATQRLEVVIMLLLALRGFSAGPASGPGSTQMQHKVTLHKYASIHLQFSAPDAPPERHDVFAVWGGAAAGKGARPLFLRGGADDYVAELEELVVTLVYGQHGIRERPNKALRLLGFLEQEEKFIKFLQRDFRAFLPDQRVLAAVVAAAGNSGENEDQGRVEKKGGEQEQEQEQEEEGKAETSRLLRSLQSAITSVVIEKERQARARAAKRHKANEHAAYGPAESAQSNKLGAQAAVVLADAFLASLQQSVLGAGAGAGAGAGRGRGKTLPAWMTAGAGLGAGLGSEAGAGAQPQPQGQGQGQVQSQVQEGEAAAPQQQQQQQQQPLLRGVGRGVSNLPAWMTQGAALGLSASASSSSSASASSSASSAVASGAEVGVGAGGLYAAADEPEQGVAAADPLDGLGQWERHTKGIGRKLLQKFGFGGSEEDKQRLASALSAEDLAKGSKFGGTDKGGLGFGKSKGRGKGTNLPSWVTQQQQQQQLGGLAGAGIGASSSEPPGPAPEAETEASTERRKRKFDEDGDGESAADESQAQPATQRRRTSEQAARALIESLASFVGELQRALQCQEVDIEWAKDLLVSAIEQLSEGAGVAPEEKEDEDEDEMAEGADQG